MELPPGPISRSRPPKKARHKTFTGCWTCRTRRVKCDEARPFCKRCVQSSRTCEGYQVRLSWKGASDRHSTHQQASATALSRSLMGPSSISTGSELSFNHLNEFLNECDTAVATRETRSFGPFCVFRLTPEASSPLARSGSSTVSSAARHGLATDDDFAAAPDANITPTLGELSATWVDNDIQQSPESSQLRTNPPAAQVTPTLAESNPHINLEGQYSPVTWEVVENIDPAAVAASTLCHISEPLPLDRAEVLNERREEGEVPSPLALSAASSTHKLPTWLEDPTRSSRHLDDLPDLSCQKYLIHHWVFFLCKHMVPIDTVHSPYRTIYLRFALEGLMSPSNHSSTKIALYHGLCSVAAESLLHLHRAPKGITKLLAARHDRLALQHLQASIRHFCSDNLDSTLAAILICIMRDTICGYPRHWRDHVQGALRCVMGAGDLEVLPGSNAQVVLEQFLCLAVLGDVSTTYDLQTLISRLPDENNYLTQYHTITKFLLESVYLINQLSANRDSVDPAVIEKLELQAYMRTPAIQAHDKYEEHGKASVALHYAHVYHIALLIHLQRKLRRARPADLQDMVEETFSHLEAAEELAGQANGCILLWPCLVVMTECCTPNMQSRALDWFRLKRRHGFGNVDLGSKICSKYWQWREENAEEALDVSWQTFVRGTDYDVVAL